MSENRTIAAPALAGLVLVATAAAADAQVFVHELEKLHPTNPHEGDYFGYSVGADGGRAVIGATGDSTSAFAGGAAYVFDLVTHQQLAKLLPTNAQNNDFFGHAVDLSGDRVVAGAPGDFFPGTGPGRAFLFDALTGQQLFELANPVGIDNDLFGYQVAIDGDRALVCTGVYSSASVHVFDVPTGQYLGDLHPTGGYVHGWIRPSLDGDLAVVGAPRDDAMGEDAGAVFVFQVSTRTELARWTAPDAAPEGDFGMQVAISGDYAAVSARPGEGDQESFVVHVLRVSTGEELTRLNWDDDPSLVTAGFGLALDGDRLAVSVGGTTSSYVHLFEVPSGALLARLEASDVETGGGLGSIVALDSGVVVVGHPKDDDNGLRSGAAYLFDATRNTGRPFCFGDGSGAACPCDQLGAPGRGCANTAGAGAVLTAYGDAYLSTDALGLSVAGAPPQVFGLFLRAADPIAQGAGTPMGDGLLCVAGQSARSQVELTSANGRLFVDDWWGQPLHTTSYGPGVPARYQFWYRDTSNFCTGLGFNYTNGWVVTWLP